MTLFWIDLLLLFCLSSLTKLMTESNKGSFLTLNVLLHIYNATELLDSVEKKITLFYGGLKKGKIRQKVALLLTCQTPSVMFCHLPDSGRQVTSIFQGLSLSRSRGREGEHTGNEVGSLREGRNKNGNKVLWPTTYLVLPVLVVRPANTTFISLV